MTHYISKQNNKIIFGTNSLDRMIIDNTGNVGIGTTLPSEKLHVNGDIVSTGITCTGDINLSGDLVYSPVCCHARRDAGNITTNSLVVYNKCDINIGGAYNTSTGQFTCPSDGYYFVSTYAIMSASGGTRQAVIYLKRNGTKVGTGSWANHNDTWRTLAFTQIVQCSQNDTLDIYFEIITSSAYLYATDTTETSQYHALNGLTIYKL